MIPIPKPRRVGRPLDYTPEELDAAFDAYLAEVREEAEAWTRDTTMGETQKVEYLQPWISIAGFLMFIDKTETWWSMLETRKDAVEFVKVKTRVRTYVRDYQLAGAASGQYKENIIARLWGLADKQEQTNKVKLSAMSDEERDEIDTTFEL